MMKIYSKREKFSLRGQRSHPEISGNLRGMENNPWKLAHTKNKSTLADMNIVQGGWKLWRG